MYFKNWPGNQHVKQIKMKQFITFVQKEFYHIFRDRWTMIILLLLPIVMLILFGFMMSTEVKNTRFMVYDPSNDVSTQSIINKISMNEYFIYEGRLKNPDEIDNIFRKGRVGLIIVFSSNFSKGLQANGDAAIQLITDGSDPNTASTLTMYATSLAAMNLPGSIKTEIKLLYNPTLKGAYNYVPGVMGMILMLICAMMTSVSIAREKETGTMEVLLVSPMKPIQIIISKVIPYFFISCFNLTTILLLSVFLLGVPINGSLGLLISISLIYIFVSLSLGLLISSVVDKQMVALLISGMVLMLPVIMLSGMVFPIENLPWYFRWMSEIIPAKWFISAVKKIMIQGVGFDATIREFTVLSTMAVVLIAASLKSFKHRLE
jgi:ABC-2 type transport system permease protein